MKYTIKLQQRGEKVKESLLEFHENRAIFPAFKRYFTTIIKSFQKITFHIGDTACPAHPDCIFKMKEKRTEIHVDCADEAAIVIADNTF